MAPPPPPPCAPICSRPGASSARRSNPGRVNMAHQAEIPYGAYWSTPFARWQGAYAHLNSLEFAARVVRSELAARGIPGETFDHGVLGISVPQKHSFYGLPWLAGMAGLAH